MFSDLFKTAANNQPQKQQYHENQFNPFGGGPSMQPMQPTNQQQFNPFGQS